MHFTREPILESIISAREGFKISIKRSSSLPNEPTSEEFLVDSVEIVSFSDNLFFRSLEKPKPFLLPCTHYELVEVKETRIVLKSATHEKSIKIGGGKEQGKAAKEVVAEKVVEEIEQEIAAGEGGLPKAENVQYSPQTEPSRGDRKRDHRRKRRRGREDREWQERAPSPQAAPQPSPVQEEGAPLPTGGEGISEQTVPAVPVIPFATLIPPPTTLISETLSRYKEVMFGEISSSKPPKLETPKVEDTFIEIEEVIYEEKKPEADENNASDEPLTRVRLDESYFDKGGFGPKY